LTKLDCILQNSRTDNVNPDDVYPSIIFHNTLRSASAAKANLFLRVRFVIEATHAVSIIFSSIFFLNLVIRDCSKLSWPAPWTMLSVSHQNFYLKLKVANKTANINAQNSSLYAS